MISVLDITRVCECILTCVLIKKYYNNWIGRRERYKRKSEHEEGWIKKETEICTIRERVRVRPMVSKSSQEKTMFALFTVNHQESAR